MDNSVSLVLFLILFGLSNGQDKIVKPINTQAIGAIQMPSSGNPLKSFLDMILIPFGGNLKVGIHGDMSNVASGNVETKGSLGVSINGHDLSFGGKLGASGNLGQGLTNGGSIGLGGTIRGKPSFIKSNGGTFKLFGTGRPKGNSGNWQKMKEYVKFFSDNGKTNP